MAIVATSNQGISIYIPCLQRQETSRRNTQKQRYCQFLVVIANDRKRSILTGL